MPHHHVFLAEDFVECQEPWRLSGSNLSSVSEKVLDSPRRDRLHAAISRYGQLIWASNMPGLYRTADYFDGANS